MSTVVWGLDVVTIIRLFRVLKKAKALWATFFSYKTTIF